MDHHHPEEHSEEFSIDNHIYNFNFNNWLCGQKKYWGDFDVRVSKDMTDFKDEYILSMGDVRVRSVVMAVSAALMYRLISFKTASLLGKTRNLGVSFGLMGITFVPELFNPFLLRKK